MVAVSIRSFGGIAPRVNPRYLPDSRAQTATNVDTTKQGALTPIRAVGSSIRSLASNVTALNRYKEEYITEDGNYWLAAENKTSFAKSQLTNDIKEFIYFTVDENNTTRPPLFTYEDYIDSTDNTADGLGLYGFSAYFGLGVPAPSAAPTVTLRSVKNKTAVTVARVTSNPDNVTTEYSEESGYTLTIQDGLSLVDNTEAAENVTSGDTVTVVDLNPPFSTQLVYIVHIGSSVGIGDSIDTSGDPIHVDNVTSSTVATNVLALNITDDLSVSSSTSIIDNDSAGGLTADETAGFSKEYRSYVCTYVWTVGGREMESAPSPASDSVGVTLSSSEYLRVALPTTLPTYDSEYGITGSPLGMIASDVKVRLYRSVGGEFLLVNTTADYSLTNGPVDDTTEAEDLGEALPTLTWGPPPRDLQGLTNMSNGIVAGFTGRDIWFSEPYIPHAWPVSYVISVDSPIVALASLDTTLVVLTKERPYFIQGSSPEFMTAVQADANQGCVSADSVATMNGEVYFASPDGLIATSPRGTRIVTEQLFSYRDWNNTFDVDSLIGVTHDLKYFGFGSDLGFVYDLPTGEFTTHDTIIRAAYTDHRLDKLYVVKTDNNVYEWGGGSTFVAYDWKSKVFSFPSEISFSCAQVEAESYSGTLTAKFYADGTLVHTQTVTNRDAFRLPSVLARDWEVQLEGKAEIFNVAMAQSITELASA